jgi:hypothetical protein
MSRAYLRVARLLAAGLLGLPSVVDARPEEPPATAASQPTPQALARLSALQIELAWLSDPATFSFPLQARPAGDGLEVCGFVPDQETKNTALRLARYNANRMIVDAIALDPSLVGRSPAHDTASLQRAALEALRAGHAPADLVVQATFGGRVEVSGQVHSWEEKRMVSRMLLQALGCTQVKNHLVVQPVERAGQPSILVSADGSLSVPYHPQTPDWPVDGFATAGPAPTETTNWGCDRMPATIGPPLVTGAHYGGSAFAQDLPQPKHDVTVVRGSAILANQDSLSGQLLPEIEKKAPDDRSCWTSTGPSEFASHEPGSPGLLPRSLTTFAVPLDSIHVKGGAGSDFATAGRMPEKLATPARSQEVSPVNQVVAASETMCLDLSDKALGTNQKIANSSGRPPRVPAVQVSPQTSDGKWPTAFVGGQSIQPPVASTPPTSRIAPPVVPTPPIVRLTGDVGVVAGPTMVMQSPIVAQARFQKQVEALCGSTIRQIQFVQQDNRTVMVLTVANSSVQSNVLGKLKLIPDLEATGVQVQLIVPQ